MFNKGEATPGRRVRTITLLEQLGRVSNSQVFRSSHSDLCDQEVLSAALAELDALVASVSTGIRGSDLHFVRCVGKRTL